MTYWDLMSNARRIQAVITCGWVTNKGVISRVGRRVANTPWHQIIPSNQEILKRHNPDIAA